jgi:glycosyltransferase involved in cell wall biosynthesis
MGQAATLNKGWEMADGEILSYLSADDALLPDAISKAVRRLTEKPDTVLVYCDFYLIDMNSRIIKEVRAGDFDYSELVVKNVCFPGQGVFFRRKAYESAGPWDIRLKQVPDFDFWIRLGLQGPFERIPETLSKFRVHDGSQSCCEPDERRSNEIIQVIADFFETSELPSHLRVRKNEALSFAGVIAARSHLRAGRYRMASDYLFRSIQLFFPVIFSIHAMRFIGNGLIYRIGKSLRY